jgi:hypothetical protein
MKSISKRFVAAMLGLAGMGACAGGGGASVGSCFSPEQTPELAMDHPEAGCACAGEKDHCVSTSYQGRELSVALVCTAGRWTSVEDGPCWRPAPQSCAEGTRLGTSCLQCAPTDGCSELEHTCLTVCASSSDCTDPQHPACLDGVCGYSCGWR